MIRRTVPFIMLACFMTAGFASAHETICGYDLDDAGVIREMLNFAPELASAQFEQGRTLLHWAAIHNLTDLTKEALDKGAKVDAKDQSGRSPLQYALEHSYPVAEILVSRDADLELTDSYGSTLLHKAADNGQEKLVVFLLKNKANVNAKDSFSCTPLHNAAVRGYTKIVQHLLAGGAEVDDRNCYGETPLLSACARGHLDIVKLLLSKGADPNIMDGNGGSPLEYAELNRHQDVIAILRKVKQGGK